MPLQYTTLGIVLYRKTSPFDKYFLSVCQQTNTSCLCVSRQIRVACVSADTL